MRASSICSGSAYKDINDVMEQSADLVEVVHVFRQIINVKGTESQHAYDGADLDAPFNAEPAGALRLRVRGGIITRDCQSSRAIAIFTLQHHPLRRALPAIRIALLRQTVLVDRPHHPATGTAFRGSIMNPRNLLAILLAFVALTASSVVGTSPSEASHGTDHHVYARITARLGADGRVEFALQQRLPGSTWSDRIFPRARYFPTTATVDQWLVSSALTLSALDDPSSETDVSITARLRDNGRGRVRAAATRRRHVGWALLSAGAILPHHRHRRSMARQLTALRHTTPLQPTPTEPRSRRSTAPPAVITGRHHGNWLTDRPLGEWTGVETDSDGRVIRLYLDGNNLSGAIPPELGNLTRLERAVRSTATTCRAPSRPNSATSPVWSRWISTTTTCRAPSHPSSGTSRGWNVKPRQQQAVGLHPTRAR